MPARAIEEGSKKKTLAYSTNENGCHFYINSEGFHPNPNTIRRERYEELIGTKLLNSMLLFTSCKNAKCINPRHITTDFEMPVRTSDTFNRRSRETRNKRIEQLGLIKTIQKVKGTKTPEGDIVQTPGPGKVAINYAIFERLLHEDAKYRMVEIDKTSSKCMHGEANKLREKLENQPWFNEVSVRTDEIFKHAKDYLLEGNKILLLDACLCIKPSSMVKDGLIVVLREFLEVAQAKRQDFFIAWTYSIRNHNEEDRKAFELFDKTIRQYNGTEIYKETYRDGTPMASVCWHIKA